MTLATTAQDSFGTVIVVVVVVSTVVALVAFAGARRVYDQIGRGGLSINEDEHARPPRPAPATSGAEREAEIRQLLAARNVHRVRRGQTPLDVEEELRTLLAPTVDPELAAEVRQLVIARN